MAANNKRKYSCIFPMTIEDDDGNIIPNQMHKNIRDRKLTRKDDFIIQDFSPCMLPDKDEDILNVLIEANSNYSDFMIWGEMMFSKWNKMNPDRKMRISIKGASFLHLQKKLLKYIGIDIFCFLCMYINGVNEWPAPVSEKKPVVTKDKYYILAIIDGFRNELGIKKYRLMKLLRLQPSDISYIELSYTERAQRRQDITMYKIFQIVHALHIPPIQFLEHLYRICREDDNNNDIQDYYSDFIKA